MAFDTLFFSMVSIEIAMDRTKNDMIDLDKNWDDKKSGFDGYPEK